MIQVSNAFGTRGVRVIGAGAYVPPRAVNNAHITPALPGWPAEWTAETTQVRERRLPWELDPAPVAVAGEPVGNTDLCEAALRRAMAMAGIEGHELDAVFVVTCTPDRVNLGHDATEVHRRAGCRPDCLGLLIDGGCGGTPYIIDMAFRMIRSGTIRTAAVIGSAFTSARMDCDVWTGNVESASGRRRLPAAFGASVLGDGAGAIILRGDGGPGEGILSSMSGNDYLQPVIRRAAGLENWLPGAGNPAGETLVADRHRVAGSNPTYLKTCIDAVLAERPELAPVVQRYYFHQPSKRQMDGFVKESGLPADRVPCNVHRYGNTSAAGMLILLAEDLEQGVVQLGRGDLVLIAAVGPSVHYGAQLIRL